MRVTEPVRVHLGPDADEVLRQAVVGGGGVLSSLEHAQVLVWTRDVEGFPEPLPDHIEWVQLRSAGIETFLRAGIIDDRRTWTNASGFYADNVAEHALAMLLAGLRQLHVSAVTRWDKTRIDPAVRTLNGSTVAIVGAGGIGRSLIPRLRGCKANVLAVNRSGKPVEGAAATFRSDSIHEVWAKCDHVVLAAPATHDTHHLIEEAALDALPSHAWVVNVARGTLIDQAALYQALVSGSIAGAALDVTSPEPLRADDPLWALPNVLITPHVANPAAGLNLALAPWLKENLQRFSLGQEMLATVQAHNGY